MVGRRLVWSVQVVESMPELFMPGPTRPTQVVAISVWISPWFQANFGLTHGFPPQLVGVVWKKKSGLANHVKVGVRLGSVLIMWRACSSTGSASAAVSETVWTFPELSRAYGSSEVRPATSRSSFRTLGSVRPGCPFT